MLGPAEHTPLPIRFRYPASPWCQREKGSGSMGGGERVKCSHCGGTGEEPTNGVGVRRRRKPETALPEGWRPSEATRDWAKREYPDQANLQVLAAFRDYARAVDWRRRDWEATFRNWVRNEAKFSRQKATNQPARTYL